VSNRESIARQRLAGQDLIAPTRVEPRDVVARLGAMQAQDFAGAKWAIGLRTHGLTDADVERAFNDGEIIRTHVLRPTWHFVAPRDLRWMLALTGPRVHAVSAGRYRELGLDAAVFRRSRIVLEKALRDGKHLTRTELARAYQRARIETKAPQRLVHLLANAELDGLICSGPRIGKQHTYALVEERVPRSGSVDRDEALLDLTVRYFATRGPATLNDFAWWSGLTVADGKRGVEQAGSRLEQVTIEGRAYWRGKSQRDDLPDTETAHLLPNYDEYFIGFKDRSAIGQAVAKSKVKLPASAFLAHIVVVDGQVAGGWKRTMEKHAARVDLTALVTRTPRARRAIAAAAERYGRFLGVPVKCTIQAR
jgi:hypothetical protein